jgi:hypothetical protein
MNKKQKSELERALTIAVTVVGIVALLFYFFPKIMLALMTIFLFLVILAFVKMMIFPCGWNP